MLYKLIFFKYNNLMDQLTAPGLKHSLYICFSLSLTVSVLLTCRICLLSFPHYVSGKKKKKE